jgi:hypothetical protein
MARVQNVVRKVEPHDSVERYSKLGVEVIQGHARITSPWTVEVTTEQGPADPEHARHRHCHRRRAGHSEHSRYRLGSACHLGQHLVAD